ncbi:MAG: hypothetical protein Q8R32_01990 [bacterium]|nr:hypothetical protein [bacterium]
MLCDFDDSQHRTIPQDVHIRKCSVSPQTTQAAASAAVTWISALCGHSLRLIRRYSMVVLEMYPL